MTPIRTLGLLGGMSWESTAIYYRLLNEAVRARRGGLHSAPLLLWSADFAAIEALQAAGDWDAAGTLLAGQAAALARAGAAAIVLCTNTMHRVAPAIAAGSGVPLLHIADATAAAATRLGVRRPLLLGTRFTMEGAFYAGHMRDRHGIEVVVPDEADRALVHRVIYEELCLGLVRPESRAAYRGVIDRHRGTVDSVVYGCTEVGMLLTGADHPGLPAIDSTQAHVDAAVAFAMGD